MTEAMAFPAAYRPGNRPAVDVQHLPVAVGARAALGAQHARVDLDRVEGRRVQRAEGGLRTRALRRITPPAVVDALAAVEVGILAPGGLLVPPRHRLLEGLGRDIDGLGQRGQVGRLRHPVRRCRFALEAREAVAGQVVPIEDHPRGVVDVLEAAHVDDVEGGPQGVVVRRLVGEPAAPAVHHDAVRTGALAVDLPGGHLAAHRDVDNGHPPRLAHVAESRAHAHRHLQAVSGVGRDGRGAHQRAAAERPHELGVPLEAAGRDDHAASGTHLDRNPRAAGRLEPDARDPASVPQQLDRAHAGTRLDTAVQAGLEQRADQSLPGPPLVADLAPLKLRGIDALRGAAAQGCLAHRDVAGKLRPHRDPLAPAAELDEREQGALQRPAPSWLGAGVLGLVVGKVLDDLEPDRRVLLQPGHRFGAGVDERRGQVHVDEAIGQGFEVGQRLLPAVVDTELGHVRVHRNPHHAAGPGARAADRIGLLEQPHAGALGGGPDGGTEGRRAGSQDDDIERFHRGSLAIGRMSFY